MTFNFGDKVTSERWLENEEHLVLSEGRMGGVSVVNSRGGVQIVHCSFLTRIEKSVITYTQRLSKAEEQFKVRLDNLENSVDTILAGFPKRVKADTEPESKFNFKDSI